MSPAARAIGWEFRRRHRWGLIALGVYLAVLAAIKTVIVVSGRRITLDSPQSFAFAVVIPLTATFTYFLAVFTYGLDGDLAARQSMYPPRMFTRPVSAAALAGWPMLFGCVAMGLLWAASRVLAVWPTGLDVPLVWPAFLAASLLAWTQALTWMPYPLPGLRIAAAVIWLTIIDAIVLLGLNYQAREVVMVAILAPQIPLAYATACYAVSRGRRGDGTSWSGVPGSSGSRVGTRIERRRPFSSPMSAQAWIEWRQHGRSLPVWVAILLPLELALLRVTGDTPTLVFTIIGGAFVTPPFMAVFTAASVRRSATSHGDAYGLSTWIATRPLTTAQLTAAKLRATVRSTFATWLLVLVAVPLALVWTNRWVVVADRVRHLAGQIGTARVVTLAVLVGLGLILWTWKQLVQSLYIGLTGRERLIKGSMLVTLALLFLVGPVVQAIMESRQVDRALWNALPAILSLLVCARMAIAGWVAARLQRSGLLSDQLLVAGAGVWCLAVLALYATLGWFMDSPLFPSYILLLVAILAVPLTRLSAAPLALAWNRHR